MPTRVEALLCNHPCNFVDTVENPHTYPLCSFTSTALRTGCTTPELGPFEKLANPPSNAIINFPRSMFFSTVSASTNWGDFAAMLPDVFGESSEQKRELFAGAAVAKLL